MSALRDALESLAKGFDLDTDDAHRAVSEILGVDAPEPQIAAFLTAIRIKGETAEELAGAAGAVRDRMIPFEVDRRHVPLLLDTCGTGGDGASTANVSTATAIVIASIGVPVVKHGNRAASGRSGSSEVLEELGIAIEAEPAVLHRCLDEVGITFLYAPKFHPALKALAPIRRLLPFRTLFNLTGPLVNPARPPRQLIGAPGDSLAGLMAGALVGLGIDRAAVVGGSDGLDEVTLAGPTSVRWVESGSIRLETWTPEDFGLPYRPVAEFVVVDPADGADRLRRLFAGERGAIRDVVLANASAALMVAGRSDSLIEGVGLGAEAIDSGAAARLLDAWSRISRRAP